MNDPHPLFRKEALAHRFKDEWRGGLPRISPPWSWGVLYVALGILTVAILLSIFGRMEISSRGKGVVRASGGIRQLVAQVGGTVRIVHIHSGMPVSAGVAVVSLEVPGIHSQLLEADHEFKTLTQDARAHLIRQDALYEQQVGQMRARVEMLKEVVVSQKGSVELAKRKLEANMSLVENGLISKMNSEEAREALSQAGRALNASGQSLRQAEQELAAMEERHQDDRWRIVRESESAKHRRDAIGITMAQAEIVSPVDGLVEALLVKDGDVVQPGQVLAKVVTTGSEMSVVAFVPEKDRAFIGNDSEVKVELEQYPYMEFGTVSGKITRVSADLASPYEVRDALGDDGRLESPSYRVDVRLEGITNNITRKIRLRSGMVANVRFILRRQRPIILFLEPLRRWLE